jgi:ribonuclease HII
MKKEAKSGKDLSVLSQAIIKNESDRFRSKGYDYCIGVDEAGRGPLAGPVVAAAGCFVGDPQETMTLEQIRDSKLITNEAEREEIYEKLVKHPNFIWSASAQSNLIIDDINILQATMKAMREATEGVVSQLPKNSNNNKKMIALIDGNRVPENMPVEATPIISGDSLMYSIAAASIIAKVTRDRLCQSLHNKYPQYGFDQHKGYPSPAHRAILSQIGPCPEHRVSYRPVREAAEKHGVLDMLARVKLKAVKEPASPKKTKKGAGAATKVVTPVKAARSVAKAKQAPPVSPSSSVTRSGRSTVAAVSPPSTPQRCAIL